MFIFYFFCSDTALNLAVHRQKYPVVDLLLQYHANPNVYNQAGKTALHRAVILHNDESINLIRKLLAVSFIKDLFYSKICI
jgi:ankyrin repeat protein